MLKEHSHKFKEQVGTHGFRANFFFEAEAQGVGWLEDVDFRFINYETQPLQLPIPTMKTSERAPWTVG